MWTIHLARTYSAAGPGYERLDECHDKSSAIPASVTVEWGRAEEINGNKWKSDCMIGIKIKKGDE
jgi:hypothetical protein